MDKFAANLLLVCGQQKIALALKDRRNEKGGS